MVKKQKPATVTDFGNEEQDYKNRMRNYSIIMGLRFICIALSLMIPFPWNIITILFAVFSPWFAVVIANNKKPTASKVEKPLKELK